jgi:Flp pilus assembly protein TadG
MITRNKQAGQSLLMIAFSMVAFIAMMGLAIDMGYVRYMQRQIQTAADNAALAGAIQIPYANTSGLGATTVTTAAQSASAEDNFKDGVNGVQVNVCAPPNTSGVYGACPSTPFAGTGGATLCTVCAEVTVTDTQVPTFFSQNFGAPKYLTLSATSVAEGSLNCIYGLDTTSGGAMSLFLAVVDSTCGVVDNSNLSGLLGAICAPSFQLKGSDNVFIGGLFCGGGFHRATATKITAAVPDPFAYLASEAPTLTSAPAPYGNPPANTCSAKAAAQIITASIKLTPTTTPYFNNGLNCGGLEFKPASDLAITITFTPGTYMIVGNPNAGIGALYTRSHFGQGNVVVNFGSGTYYLLGGITDNDLFGTAFNFNATQGTPSLFVLYGGGLTLTGSGGNGAGSIGAGNGVTFYNTGIAGTYSPTGCVTCYGPIQSYFDWTAFCNGLDPHGHNDCGLVAPTSGPYAGILFWQDPNNKVNANFVADANFGGDIYHEGAYYFPGNSSGSNPTVNFDFDFGITANYTYLVARDISWALNFTFNRDTHTLPNGSPLAEGTAVLVQ